MSFNIKPGQDLSNEEIIKVFRCGARGGMRRSTKTNTLVIVSDHTKKFYSDSWDNNVFRYTGMGQTGDQSLTFAQNRTLNESNTNGVNVHLFEVYTEGKYIYQGQVELAGKPYQETQPDFKGNDRTVWIFPLKLTHRTLPAIVPEETFEREQLNQEKKTRLLSDTELAKRVAQSTKKAPTQKVVSERFVRNEYVTEFAKRRAGEICQLCKRAAPFKDRNGTPYLEVHHIEWLSRGGKDAIDNAVALCPNCHRKMHIVDAEEDKSFLRALGTAS